MEKLSGKFVLRISEKLHFALRKHSEKQGTSLNSLCTDILTSSLTSSSAASFSYSKSLPSPFLEKLIETWKDKLCGIILFGSVARKEETEKSDIDLLLILKESIELNRHLYREWDHFYEPLKHSLHLFKEISPQFVTLPKDPFQVGSLWYDVALQGQVLWYSNEDIFLALQKIREAIADGKIKRCFSHGHPYWIKLNLK